MERPSGTDRKRKLKFALQSGIAPPNAGVQTSVCDDLSFVLFFSQRRLCAPDEPLLHEGSLSPFPRREGGRGVRFFEVGAGLPRPFCPGGTFDSSPPIHRWVPRPPQISVPEGRSIQLGPAMDVRIPQKNEHGTAEVAEVRHYSSAALCVLCGTTIPHVSIR